VETSSPASLIPRVEPHPAVRKPGVGLPRNPRQLKDQDDPLRRLALRCTENPPPLHAGADASVMNSAHVLFSSAAPRLRVVVRFAGRRGTRVSRAWSARILLALCGRHSLGRDVLRAVRVVLASGAGVARVALGGGDYPDHRGKPGFQDFVAGGNSSHDRWQAAAGRYLSLVGSRERGVGRDGRRAGRRSV